MAVARALPAAPGTGATDAVAPARRRLLVRGIVQGVGFRPFVRLLAVDLGLSGFVRNTSGGVVIEVEGASETLDAFATRVIAEAPPLAQIASVESGARTPLGDRGFRIDVSQPIPGEHQPISPDAATCADCVRELFDAADPRHRYAFINCTNCGPRFTIIEDIPYDRALTTMRRFAMCAACRREYSDPTDRRFHAQPICCADCGPGLWLTTAAGTEIVGDGLAATVAALDRGDIVAIKGLGGFQLACDAASETAVERLRQRKHRPSKPFALMAPDLSTIERICSVSDEEAAILAGTVRPIVLLRRHPGVRGGIADAVAPGLGDLGMMLPSTPLHHLLLHDLGRPLVMTSGNLSEEPIAKDNAEALSRLGGIADSFLLHDRDIHARYDDSVVRVAGGGRRMLRRARGYCPKPVSLEETGAAILGLGGHLKNTFCVLKQGHAFVGPHVGDLDHPLARSHQEEALATYLRLFRTRPDVVACDLHPDYASTSLAERWWQNGALPVQVQHHHAHIASVMAEHGLRGRLLGVAFDGAGHGPDGSIWGGELLLCDEASFQRVGHIAPVRQPGGDLCVREGWRMAIAYLVAAGREPGPPASARVDVRKARMVARVAASSSAAPTSTSAGRLFDAVASILGVAHESSYEAEAAMHLEAMAARVDHASVTAFPVAMAGAPLVLDSLGLFCRLADAARGGRPADELAAIFHESLAVALAAACARLAAEHRLGRVALSGGVFQNAVLLGRLSELLRERDLEVYANGEVPANDGGISLGQVLVAAARMRAQV